MFLVFTCIFKLLSLGSLLASLFQIRKIWTLSSFHWKKINSIACLDQLLAICKIMLKNRMKRISTNWSLSSRKQTGTFEMITINEYHVKRNWKPPCIYEYSHVWTFHWMFNFRAAQIIIVGFELNHIPANNDYQKILVEISGNLKKCEKRNSVYFL